MCALLAAYSASYSNNLRNAQVTHFFIFLIPHSLHTFSTVEYLEGALGWGEARKRMVVF